MRKLAIRQDAVEEFERVHRRPLHCAFAFVGFLVLAIFSAVDTAAWNGDVITTFTSTSTSTLTAPATPCLDVLILVWVMVCLYAVVTLSPRA